MSTASSTRSSLDGKLKAVQTESDLEAASLTGILDLVDSTVERRVEKVVERRGFRTVAGKIVRSAATQVRYAYHLIDLAVPSSSSISPFLSSISSILHLPLLTYIISVNTKSLLYCFIRHCYLIPSVLI